MHYPPCDHIKWQEGRIRLFRAAWESGPAPTHGWLIDAKAQQLQFGFVVDATLESVGLVFRRPGPPNPEGNVAICELFCGGFAGWAQAAAFLNEHELPVRPVFALDRDCESAEIYAINHAPSRRVCRRPLEAVQSLQDNTLSPTEPMVCQCDVREGWWLQFTPVVDVVTMSPPCPAWSSAHVAYGLTRPDGFDTVEGLFKARLLSPRAIAFENVKNMQSHAHFPVLEEVIRWLGLRVKWASVVNLADVLPQARERLLMTLIPADGDVKPTFQFTSWRARDHLSLQTSDILRTAGCLSHTISPPLDAEILRMYLHPQYVPGDRCGDFKTAKTYRLKNEQNTCACVLAHYGFAHELGEEVRSKNGLFGSLLILNDEIRWFSLPELCSLMGLLRPWTAPSDARISYHMVGNAIAVPHALLCLVNTIGQMQRAPWMSTPVDIVDRALDLSLTASRQEVLLWRDQGKIHIDRFAVSPTLQWSCDTPRFALWKIPCGPNFQHILVQPGLQTARVIRSIFPHATGASLRWRPARFPDVQIPLTVSDQSGFDTMAFDGLFGHFSIQESDFVRFSRPFVLVFTPDQIFVMSKQSGTKIHEIHHQLLDYLSMDDAACDIWGTPARPDSLCPDAICFMSPIKDTPPSDFLSSLFWHREESCRYVEAEYSVLFAYIRFAQDTGLASMIECLGWSMSIVPASDVRRPLPRLLWQPKPNRPAVHADVFDTSFTTRLAQALFPQDIPSWEAVHICVKFWSLWQPVRTLKRSTKVEDILRPWSIASRHVGKPSHLRAICRGLRLSNEQTLSSYLPTLDSREVMRVHFVLELQGGGNKLEAHQKLRQSTVEFLLQSGADPTSVNAFTKDLYEKAGFARLQHTMQFRDPEERLSQLLRLAKSMHVRPIAIESPDSERLKKLKTWKPRHMPSFATVHAADFRIHPEAFVKSNNQPAPILGSPEATKDGVILLDAECATDFAKSLKPQPDSLAIAVVGRECTLGPEGCQSINLPVLDRHDAQVIIKACLHQCGKNKITLKTKAGDDIPIEDSKLVAVTAWRNELSSDSWSSLVQSPAKFCATQLSITPSEHYSVSPWGRVFRDEGTVCEPDSASSFQYHVRIKTTGLNAILKRSGFDGIYVTPKSETLNRADEVYAVVWQPQSTFQQVSEFAKSLDHQLGIARSNAGSVHHGVRIHSEHFAETFSKAFPDKKVPPVIVTHYLAKVSPTPIGARSADS